MLLNYLKFKTPTMRQRSYVLDYNIKVPFELKFLIKVCRRKSGRNVSGQITTRGRQNSSKFLTCRPGLYNLSNESFFINEFILNKVTRKLFNVVFMMNGAQFALPAVNFSVIGETEFGVEEFSPTYTNPNLGIPTFLKFLSYFTKFSNVTPYGQQNIIFATSPGTFAVKLKASKKEKLLKVKLPSTSIKFFSSTTLVVVGSNYSEEKTGLKPGKAGFNRNLGFRPISRGVARNPVDHPNGGRTKSCQPEKSPWGWVAKKNK